MLTSVPAHATGDVFPASDWNTYLQGNLNHLIIAGADLASAATITPTAEYHKVTGAVTIDNLTPATPLAGQQVRLWFAAALTIRNNGGGTGNIRTRSGSDRAVAANEIVTFTYDGALWRESGGVGVGASFKGCLAVQTSAQSIPNITNTLCAFQGETFDTDGYHDVATNNHRFTAIRAGKHRLSGRIWWPDNATGLRYIYVNSNTARADEERRKPLTGDWNTYYFEGTLALAPGDWMEISLYQDSGGAAVLAAGTTASPGSGTHALFEELG